MFDRLVLCGVLVACGGGGGGDDDGVITSLTADKGKLLMGESTRVTATIDTAEAIASATMQKDGNAIGTFAVDAASPSVYHTTLAWTDIVRTTSASKVGEAVAESIEARFVDASGMTSMKSMTIDLWCGASMGVCRAGCSTLDTMDDCGRCGNTCGMVTLESDPNTQMSGGINDTRCEGPANGLECGEIVYYANVSSTNAPRTCKAICEAQTHAGRPLKCSNFCGSLAGSIAFGNGTLAGEAWYVMQTQQMQVPIASCEAAPAGTASGLPLNETRCCCLTQ